MKHRKATILTATAGLALASACSGTGGPTSGGAYEPRGDVTMLVPFGAGGGSDQAGRALAQAMETAADDLDVTVENREGGSGAVGYAHFLGKKGDPETLLATETALLALPTASDVPFAYEDFTPIAKIADDYTLLVTRAGAPYDSCSDVVGASKKGRVVAGISGRTGLDNIVLTLTEDETGATFDRVPFESGGELSAALLGGQIDIASLNPGEVLGQLRSGDLKALCAFAEERYDYAALDDVPTASEQGIDVAFAQFRGVLAPGDITDEERRYWVDVMRRVVRTEQYDQYVTQNRLQPRTLMGEEFTHYLGENQTLVEKALG